VTFLGCVQRRHLPGQIVIAGPGCELVDAHCHTHPKGVRTACAVMPPRVTSDGASGVWPIEFWKSVGVREPHRGRRQ
jgi:hypothetical protein